MRCEVCEQCDGMPHVTRHTPAAHLLAPQFLYAEAQTLKQTKFTQAQQALQSHLRLLLLPDTRPMHKSRDFSAQRDALGYMMTGQG